MKLNSLAVVLLVVTVLSSCKKKNQALEPEKHPDMAYQNLGDQSVGFGQSARIDLDKNGKTDILIRTEQVSYELNTKVKNTYLVESAVNCNLAVDVTTETTPHYTKGTPITRNNLPQHQWFNVLSITLMQQVFTNNTTYWEGNWKNSAHEYLPLQLIAAGKLYMGWIELSTDTVNGKLILHRAAICTEPEAAIKAGE